jgi:hypothetical protein
MKMDKYRVVYELGNPDYGHVTRHEAETMAVSMSKAIANVWYRVGRDDTFFVVRAVVV